MLIILQQSTMLALLNRLIFIIIVLWFISSDFFVKHTRLSTLILKLRNSLKQLLSYNSSFWVVYLLFFFLFLANLTGNLPLRSVPTLFYSQTLTLSLLFWIPIIVCVSYRQLKSFLSHMLPYGSPLGLILLLPLIEIFSQVIRPFTLMIRLRTNLSRGHIILYIFSYFTLLSDALSTVIVPAITVLFILEICISMLQAYIFVTLVSLYIVETI